MRLELKTQRSYVKNLKKRSLWSKTLEEVSSFFYVEFLCMLCQLALYGYIAYELWHTFVMIGGREACRSCALLTHRN